MRQKQREKEGNQPATHTRRQRVKQDPIVFSCIFCFWQMKNVNCPVCIWEFLHYSSASLVPAAPSPWQLPAPCSKCAHTYTNTHTNCFFFFSRMCRCNGLDDWLTLWPLRSWCVSMRLCVCMYGSLIFERHAMHTHACCLSKECELLVAEHMHTLTNAQSHTCTHTYTHSPLLCFSTLLQLARLCSPQPRNVKPASLSM